MITQTDMVMNDAEPRKNVIIVSDDFVDTIYDHIIVDNSKHVCIITIPNGDDNDYKQVSLLHHDGYLVVIHTSFGSCIINPSESMKRFIFSNNMWHILDKNNNFYSQLISNGIPSIGIGYSFGSSVTLNHHGNLAIIGCITANNTTGAVHIYTCNNNTWMFDQELEHDITEPAFFGVSSSICYSNTILVIGCSGYNECVGACCVYNKDNERWVLTHKLTGSNNNGKSYQGATTLISPDGNVIFVSGTNDSGYGAVWIFEKHDNEWIELQKITCEHIKPNFGKRFGTYLSTSHAGTKLLISSLDNIYVYKRIDNCYKLQHMLFNKKLIITSLSPKCSRKFGFIAKVSKNYDVYIVKNDKINAIKHSLFKECNIPHGKLLSCNFSDNMKTISVIGYDVDNNTVLWNFVKSSQYYNVSKYIIDRTKIGHITSSMASSGRSILIGFPNKDNYNGECIVF
jgi:hypothetical protein